MIHRISNNKEEGAADVAHRSRSDQSGLRCSEGPPTCSFCSSHTITPPPPQLLTMYNLSQTQGNSDRFDGVAGKQAKV